MRDPSALRLALELLHSPWQARRMRTVHLPKDVQTLLHIAAGDEEVIRSVSEAACRSRDSVTEAAAFFVEQVMLHPDADSYRILGVQPQAPNAELRRNMALLLRWLHPDRDRNGERSVFAARVTGAWNDLKTPERREAYDRLRDRAASKNSSGNKADRNKRSKSTRHMPHGAMHLRARQAKNRPYSQSSYAAGQGSGSILRRVLLFLFGRAAH